jgi:hypothetical protein
MVAEIIRAAMFEDRSFERLTFTGDVANAFWFLADEVVEAPMVSFLNLDLCAGEHFREGAVASLRQKETDCQFALADVLGQRARRNLPVDQETADRLPPLGRSQIVNRLERLKQFVARRVLLEGEQDLVMGQRLALAVEGFRPADRIE